MQQQLIYFTAFSFESKDKNITPEKFYPLPWEEEEKVKKLKARKTPEQIKKAFEKIDKNLNGIIKHN